MEDFDGNSPEEIRGSIETEEENQDCKVKRPLNAYNIFYLERQPKLKAEQPLLNGNEISKLVGMEWKEMSAELRQPYIEQAQNLYQKFKEDNPNYHYQKSVKRSKKRKTKKEDAFYEYDVNNGPANITLSQIGSLALAQIVLSRRDWQEEILLTLRNLRAGLELKSFQGFPQPNPQVVSQQQQEQTQTNSQSQLLLQQQPSMTPQFDQSHFDPLVTEID